MSKNKISWLFATLLGAVSTGSHAEAPRTLFEQGFIGKEWIATAEVIEEQALTDKCEYEGGGFIEGSNTEGYVTMNCDGQVLALFEKINPIDHTSQKVRILDATLLPKLKKGESIFRNGECQLDGSINSSFLVIAKLGNRNKVTWKTGIRAGWAFNAKDGKIEEVAASRLVCWRPTPP